jgi:hypothetical protein
LKRILLHINKKVNTPFYQANVEQGVETFHKEEYMSVWSEAEELGLHLTIQERVEILNKAESVKHIHWEGNDYFFNNDFDYYWEELAQLIEERLKD